MGPGLTMLLTLVATLALAGFTRWMTGNRQALLDTDDAVRRAIARDIFDFRADDILISANGQTALAFDGTAQRFALVFALGDSIAARPLGPALADMQPCSGHLLIRPTDLAMPPRMLSAAPDALTLWTDRWKTAAGGKPA